MDKNQLTKADAYANDIIGKFRLNPMGYVCDVQYVRTKYEAALVLHDLVLSDYYLHVLNRVQMARLFQEIHYN